MSSRVDDDTGCCKIKARTNTANFTNMTIASIKYSLLTKISNFDRTEILVRTQKGEMLIKEKPRLWAEWEVSNEQEWVCKHKTAMHRVNNQTLVRWCIRTRRVAFFAILAQLCEGICQWLEHFSACCTLYSWSRTWAMGVRCWRSHVHTHTYNKSSIIVYRPHTHLTHLRWVEQQLTGAQVNSHPLCFH